MTNEIKEILEDNVPNENNDTKKTYDENRCPNCQAVVSNEQRFCHECATALVKKCNNCGSEVIPNGRFCPKCGQDVVNEPNGVKEYNSKIDDTKKRKKTFLRVLSIIMGIILLGTIAVEGFIIFSLKQEVEAKRLAIGDLNTKLYLMDNEKKDFEEFIDNHVSFIEDDGTSYYHKYSCTRFKKRSFWAYNTEAVPYRYRPCPLCH